MIHPVIRIFTFLVFAGLISLLGLTGLVLAGTALAVLYVLIDPQYFRPALMMIRRMRWFFLSIIVLYFWYTPGQPLMLSWLPISPDWLPTRQGVEIGTLRVLTLMLIIMAVNLLLRTSSQNELLAAIHWMARPLSWLGISRDRLAVRMVLVMESLADVQDMVRQMMASIKGKAHSLRHIGHFSSDVFSRVTVRAEETPCRTIELVGCSAPPAYQWLYPLLLGSLLYFM